MDVPDTVATALGDRPVTGRRCLEAGAGMGNATAGLLANGAARVYAVTNDPDHARTTRRRVADSGVADSGGDGSDGDGSDRGNDADRLAVLKADLRSIPLPDGSVDLITAHGLCNVLDPAALSTVAEELSRVAAPGAHLVVDDYDPLPDGTAIGELFAVENAASELARCRPALTFYPAAFLRRFFAGHGWEFERERTLLEPVPWTESHVSAHADEAASMAAECPGEAGDTLSATARRLATEIESESVGRMYSLAFRRPG
ncbi:class I SAM-dependent methyltransferase [Halorubrum sp. Atlit-26R]|uniref:class I SAM-dependent methyltransferase n=1 Tax=Halorubrum sp. Atlit-26R TaxID=2282128 RepID=UPI000EF1DD37|nr:class I SAM-dependent methyltransferase [Halorubrum sp. Atlit-26R]RLM67151.1 class I SAM-dependent methyltransferase [Halorubrum sp. Atlit-26R]